MIISALISVILINSNPVAECNGYKAYEDDSSVVVLNPYHRKIVELKYRGENVPEVRLTDKGQLVAFYPATYKLSVVDSGNKWIFNFHPDKNWYEIESYSAFDVQGNLMAVAYFLNGKTYFIAFKNFKRLFKNTYSSLFPAGLWIRNGKIFLRLYRVKNNAITEDFVVSPLDNHEWKIPKIIAVDFDGSKLVFATRKKIMVFRDGKVREEIAKGIILDVKLSKGIPIMLVKIRGRGVFIQKSGGVLKPVKNTFERFRRCYDQQG